MGRYVPVLYSEENSNNTSWTKFEAVFFFWSDPDSANSQGKDPESGPSPFSWEESDPSEIYRTRKLNGTSEYIFMKKEGKNHLEYDFPNLNHEQVVMKDIQYLEESSPLHWRPCLMIP